jgi:hypothetical protein
MFDARRRQAPMSTPASARAVPGVAGHLGSEAAAISDGRGLAPFVSWRRFSSHFAAFAGAVVLLALAPATASALAGGATMFVHSAKSGELRGGRLALHGVGHTVAWSSNGGHSGVVSIARMHRGLFGPGTPSAAGTLHVAGRRPGSESVFELSRPRYSAARQTVSYHVERSSKAGARASGVGSAAQSSDQFGAASLSIVGAPPVLGSTWGGRDCNPRVFNDMHGYVLKLINSSKWSTDTWGSLPASGTIMYTAQTPQDPAPNWLSWESDGGLFRGCQNQIQWQIIPDPYDPNAGPDLGGGAVVTFTTYWGWGTTGYSNSCSPSVSQVNCFIYSGWDIPGTPAFDVVMADSPTPTLGPRN